MWTARRYCFNLKNRIDEDGEQDSCKIAGGKSKVVTREELMMELWNTDEYVSDGTLTTIVSRLRAKLKANCNDDVIHTKKGVGYFIE